MKFTCQLKTKQIWMNSIYRKIFIYVHENLFAPQTLDPLEKFALFFALYNVQGTQFVEIKNKKNIAENQCEKHEKSSLFIG